MKTVIEMAREAGAIPIHKNKKRNLGRPPIDPMKKKYMVSISLTIAQREKMRRLGGSRFVQEMIKRAKDERPESGD